MLVEADAGNGFEADVVIQARLRRERLEQRRHAADAASVQIGDRIRFVRLDGRQRAEGKAVADEEDGLGKSGRRDGEKSESAEDEETFHGVSFLWRRRDSGEGLCPTIDKPTTASTRNWPGHPPSVRMALLRSARTPSPSRGEGRAN